MNSNDTEGMGSYTDSFAAKAVEGRRAALEQLADDRQEPGVRRSRAVVYLRTARHHPDELRAVEYQRDGCRRIAEQHQLTVVREYVDVGCPGRLDEQIELLHLLDDLSRKRDVAAVIVWDYARLGRSMGQLEQVSHHIRSCGAQIVTITGMEAARRFVQEQDDREVDENEGGVE